MTASIVRARGSQVVGRGTASRVSRSPARSRVRSAEVAARVRSSCLSGCILVSCEGDGGEVGRDLIGLDFLIDLGYVAATRGDDLAAGAKSGAHEEHVGLCLAVGVQGREAGEEGGHRKV